MVENREETANRRLRGMSDDMVGKNRDGTWEALAGPVRPNMPLGKAGGEPSYKETKGREAGRVADGAVVPMKPRKAGWREGLLLKESF
jgi:hypothetical protein